MKNTGIIREVDSLGRIVIPTEIRKTRPFGGGQKVLIYPKYDRLVIEPIYDDACAITGEITKENKRYAKLGISLSPRGAKILLSEMERKLKD